MASQPTFVCLLALFAFACNGAADTASPDTSTPDTSVSLSGTNSNTCLADLGDLQGACPADGELALPTEACCAAFQVFQEDSCGCSPLVEEVMGVNDAGLSQLDRTVDGLNGYCPGIGFEELSPDCAAEQTISGIASGAGHSYNDGACEEADWEIDAGRFQSVVHFNEWFDTFGSEPAGCVDYEELLAEFSLSFDPDSEDGETPYVDVPYGIGRYKNLKNMVEYLSIILPDINKDAWRFTAQSTQSEDSMLHFAEDGATIILGTHASVRGYKDCVDAAEGYYETVSTYVGCNTTINALSIPITSEAPSQPDKLTAIPDLVSDFYQGATLSQTWGAMDICMAHELHCTGENKQFESYDDCMAFMTARPVIAPACETEGKILSGDSLLCRFKHHFMIPFEPETHCFHIGTGLADINDHIKCVDTECTDPEVRGGPMDLLERTASEEVASCIAAADALSTTEAGDPVEDWRTGMVCE